MSQQAHNIASKGILGGQIATKGYIIQEVEQGDIIGGVPLIPGFKSGGGIGEKPPEDAQKWVRVKFEYDDKTWEQILYINDSVDVKMDNIEIEVDNQEPVVKLVGFEHDVKILEPRVNIKL